MISIINSPKNNFPNQLWSHDCLKRSSSLNIQSKNTSKAQYTIPLLYSITVLKLVNIVCIYPNEWDRLSPLKNIHASVTSVKVIKMAASSFKEGNHLCCPAISWRYFRWVPNRNIGTYIRECIPPHTIKVQLAPCQNPLTIKIAKILRSDFHLPPLEPPRGIYI